MHSNQRPTFRDVYFDNVPLDHNAAVHRDRLLQILRRLELHITEPLEPVGLLILHQTHVLHHERLEDAVDVALHHADGQIADERRIRRLGGERFLATATAPTSAVVP